ncbi:uromodulin-like 1 [Pithys albifrons albifrons]|uniref:uromodulin-like 1 n=1 Tax=Pithys albifrons albifrons TaxID=3385563 RepID=UPI003A5D1457
MRVVGREERTETEPTLPNGDWSSLGVSARSDGISTPISTGSDITTTSMATVSGGASSMPPGPRSAVTGHSSSSLDTSTAVTPSPQQSSTSSTTEEHLATTSHPPMALIFSTLSTAGITSVPLAARTAEDLTHSPTSPSPVASTSSISRATDTVEASHSPTLGVSTEISAARPSSTPSTQGQAMVEAGTTSSSMGSLSPGMASVTTHVTTPPGDSPTMSQGRQTSTEPNVKTAHSLPATSLVSLPMVNGEGRTKTTPMRPTWEGTSPGMSAGSDGVSPATPTGSDITATSMATVSGGASSMPLSPTSAVTSHSSFSPDDSPAMTPSPQQSSTSITTEEHLATTSQLPMALVFSTLSTAGITSVPLAAGRAEDLTHSPTSPSPVASTSGISRATDIIEASRSSTLGVSIEISAAQPSSTSSTQGQAMVEAGTTSSSMGSLSPGMASVTTHATTPPGDSPTMSQGRQTSTEPNVKTAHSLPATSLVSLPMVDGEGRTETTPTRPTWEGTSPGVSAGSDGVSPAIPTGITATSMDMVSGSASSLPLSPTSAGTSHSSSSPDDSPAVTPSPQQSSTSITTEEHLATTTHEPTALMFSSLSTAGITSAQLAVTAVDVTDSPAASTNSTNPEVSISSPSPTSGITKASLSSTLGSNTETSAAQPTSAPATVEPETALPSMWSPFPSTTMASIASSATTPPGEGESLTTNQGSRMTAEPSAEPSHSLPATSLVTPSMTNFSISTSVNPSVTETCSPITLSIQLENVTSTMIQFSWKPQGGRRDSPYTVSLLGESGEMKRILNETRTAFENLISDHKYQISVDVSTCSQNVSTSLTVQTAAEVYSGTTRITNEEFKPEYQNKSSREFQEFETKFIAEITKHLRQEIQELKNETKMRIVINSLKNGSVIVLFDVVFDVGHNLTQPEISRAFTEALNMSTEFDIDLQKTVIEARNSCQPGLYNCSPHAACTAKGATYSCQCNEGFTDTSPQVPGRVCQQDLPSQQTTPVTPQNETTGSTELTTPVLSENETTGITELTTPVAPQNKTTGITEMTSTVPPQNHTTGVTEQTTPSPPQNHTTGFTGSTSNSIFTTTFTSVPSTLSDQPSTDNSYSWRVAVIVLGVLLGVALVLILLAILFFIYMRKKSGKYLVEPTGLMGNFVYKHL